MRTAIARHREGDYAYLRAMLAEAGFVKVQLAQADLRYERQEAVAGHVIIAARGPSAGGA